MLERLTIVLGLCVSAIGWLFAYITTDLTSVPVLYYSIYNVTSSIQGTETSTALIDLRNLSTHEPVPPLINMQIIATSADPKNTGGCILGIPVPSGLTWTIKNAAPVVTDKEHADIVLPLLIPGVDLRFQVPVAKDCQLNIKFELPQDMQPPYASGRMRILTSGFEATIISNFVAILSAMVGAFALLFIIAFLVACWAAISKAATNPANTNANSE